MTLTPAQLAARDGRICVTCGAPLVRRPSEYPYQFARRIACNRICGNRYMARCGSELPRVDMLARFEDKYIPEPNSGCWLWIGALVPDGYGSFRVSRGKSIKAHRAAWTLYREQIPDGAHVLHKCDTRCCVNPDHLFLGDNAANVADRVAKGRSGSAPGSRQGLTHLTEADVAEIFRDARTHQIIADDFGVNKSAVWAIKNGLTWRHVTQGAVERRGVAKGEASGLARLSERQVIAIRQDERSQSKIATDFGVSQSLVSMIKRRVIWAHLGG